MKLDGTLQARYDYDAYGRRMTITQNANYLDGCDFGYTGHFTRTALVVGRTELVLTHFRAYDPTLGRWLSEDPLGETANAMGNLYNFVGCEPLQPWDRLGLMYGPYPGVMIPSKDAERRGYEESMGQETVLAAGVMTLFKPGPENVLLGGWILRLPSGGKKVEKCKGVGNGVDGACDAAKTAAGAKELSSPGARAFMRGEKKLADLSADEVANAIKGNQQAADAAKTAAHRAYQEARIRALRGEADPPGNLLDFMKNFKEGGGE